MRRTTQRPRAAFLHSYSDCTQQVDFADSYCTMVSFLELNTHSRASLYRPVGLLVRLRLRLRIFPRPPGGAPRRNTP